MAPKQTAQAEGSVGSKGGSPKVGKFVTLAVAAIVIYVVLQVGVPTAVNFLDPGGAGGLLVRLPHMIRNAGVVGVGIGIVTSLIRPWKDLGHHMIWYGVIALVVGLLGPTALERLGSSGPAAFANFLDSLGHLKGVSLQ